MPRPKPLVPVDVPFHVRTTKAEAEALGVLIRRWGEKLTAQGIHIFPDKTAWFRGLVRKLAADEGIPVNDPPAPAPPEPVKRSPKSKSRKS